MYIRNNIQKDERIRKAQNNYIERALKKTKLQARHVEIRDIISNDVYMTIDGEDYKLTHEPIRRLELDYDYYGNAKLPLGYALYKRTGGDNPSTELIREDVEMMVWKN